MLPNHPIRRFFIPGLLLLAASAAHAAAPGLPADFEPDPALPTPADVLGFEPGDKHPRNDQIVAYLKALAGASEHMKIEVRGHTHDGRELVLAYFATPERLENLDQIRAGRAQASRDGEGPPVVWLAYSVHGNEASGASASVVTAWYMAASGNAEVGDWLDEMIIVMEPVINPDGLDRFAHWVNMHAGRHPSADPADREHREAWPNGRTNYYWFDLNRDWLPLVHPESRTRIQHYHQWRPHVLTDAHEMGHQASYFFQPGVPQRNNPMTPQRNYELTGKLAEFHGEILDQAGQPHFTRELFDDFYIGKGSTYPDLTGGVGILFEQGSARGHRMDTPWGERRFHDAVANQVRTSISTLRGSLALADELIDYQAGFFRDGRRSGSPAGWVLADGGDPARAARLIELLLGHAIEIRPVTGEVSVAGDRYGPGSAWVIPGGQDQHRFIRAIFDTPTELPMETFYDVSAWPLQLAHNLPLSELGRLPAAGDPLETVPRPQTRALAASEPAAWLVPWNQHRAPAVAAQLLADGYRIQATTRPITAQTDAGQRELVRGSLIVHPRIQDENRPPLRERLAGLAEQFDVEVLAARSGLSIDGPDLGGPSAPMLQAPNPAMLTGPGLNANNAGYIWHWFDTRIDRPLTRIDWLWLFDGLDGFTHLILPDGTYEFMPGWASDAIEGFVRGGGTLIAIRRAAAWVEEMNLDWEFAEADDNGDETDPAREPRPYGDYIDDFSRELIGGSLLWMDLDTTHPLAFGYQQDSIAVFRRGTQRLKPLANPYVHPGRYPEDLLAAGHLSEQNRERLAGTPALSASRHGPGLIIRIADDYLFRGYFAGTEKLFANALFFSSLIGETPVPETLRGENGE